MKTHKIKATFHQLADTYLITNDGMKRGAAGPDYMAGTDLTKKGCC